MVLNYLSDAAGFIIVQDTRVNGTVSVIGKHVTRDEAVDLLNSELNKNGYAAIREGPDADDCGQERREDAQHPGQ